MTRNPSTDAAREAARTGDGRFGSQPRAEAAVDLRSAPGPAHVAQQFFDFDRSAREEKRGAERRNDTVAAQAAQARLDVVDEVRVMLGRPDLEPVYDLASEWRKTVMTPRLLNATPWPRPVDADHALRCRDFCFVQAARFGCEARDPDPRDEEWMREWEWRQVLERHAYANALTDSYCYWAVAFDEGATPDPARVERLRATVAQPLYDHTLTRHFRGDPAPDRTAEWHAATSPAPADEGDAR